MKEIEKKQKELKKYIKKVGLSQSSFAKQYYLKYIEENDEIYNRIDEYNFIDKFKKQLQRDSTSLEKIEIYLKFLSTLSGFKALDCLYISNYFDLMSDEELLKDGIDEYFKEQMSEISKSISDRVINEEKDK